ncbi:unnamed protein product [Lampetra planeri]
MAISVPFGKSHETSHARSLPRYRFCSLALVKRSAAVITSLPSLHPLASTVAAPLRWARHSTMVSQHEGPRCCLLIVPRSAPSCVILRGCLHLPGRILREPPPQEGTGEM